QSYTFPSTTGTNGYALITNGAGVLSWSAVATSSSALAGELGGTLASATINNNAVTSAKILDGTIVNADINATAGIAATKIGTGAVDNTELSYLDGVTSNIQTQINGLRTVPTGGTAFQYLSGTNSWQT